MPRSGSKGGSGSGIGTLENHARALFTYARAAEGGSEVACYALAQANRLGLLGLDKDAAEASRWYRKMACSGVKNADPSAREKAGEWLRSNP